MSDGKNEKTFLLHIVKREKLLGGGNCHIKKHTQSFFLAEVAVYIVAIARRCENKINYHHLLLPNPFHLSLWLETWK